MADGGLAGAPFIAGVRVQVHCFRRSQARADPLPQSSGSALSRIPICCMASRERRIRWVGGIVQVTLVHRGWRMVGKTRLRRMVKLKQKIKSLGGSSGSGIFDSNVERLPRIDIHGKLACCGIEWT